MHRNEPKVAQMKSDTKHLSILEAMVYVKHNMAPLMVHTFEQGLALAQQKQQLQQSTSLTVSAYKLGELELNEEIVDTTLFLRQITAAMYPSIS